MALGIPAIAWIENFALVFVVIAAAVLAILAMFWWASARVARAARARDLRRIAVPGHHMRPLHRASHHPLAGLHGRWTEVHVSQPVWSAWLTKPAVFRYPSAALRYHFAASASAFCMPILPSTTHIALFAQYGRTVPLTVVRSIRRRSFVGKSVRACDEQRLSQSRRSPTRQTCS
jgi:hypothetical protein